MRIFSTFLLVICVDKLIVMDLDSIIGLGLFMLQFLTEVRDRGDRADG